jgi:hypothetical protein
MNEPENDTRAVMGVCVSERCLSVAVANDDWDGQWCAVQLLHEEAFQPGAEHVQRVDGGLQTASVIAQWAFARGVTRARIEQPGPGEESVSQSELSAITVAELIRVGIEVTAARLESAQGADEIRLRLLERGAPEGLCTAQYVAIAMLGEPRQRRTQRPLIGGIAR